eukprot:Nk52_evm88s207 gene=Nk52_evmTU88s207
MDEEDGNFLDPETAYASDLKGKRSASESAIKIDENTKDIGDSTRKQKRSASMVQPSSTKIYHVKEGDSLMGVAVKHGCTIGELRSINKLHSSQILCGQVLFVPEGGKKVGSNLNQPSLSASSTLTYDESLDGSEESLKSSAEGGSSKGNQHSSGILHRVPAMFITDGQGVVKGVMMISTHRIIFQPQMNDALVKERGIEAYQVNQRVSALFSVSINNDLINFGKEETPTSRDDSFVGVSAKGNGGRRGRFSSVTGTSDTKAEGEEEVADGSGSLSVSNPDLIEKNDATGSETQVTLGPFAKPKVSDLPKYIRLEFHSRKGFNNFWFAVKNEFLNDGLSATLESICLENEAKRYHVVEKDFEDPEIKGEISKTANGKAVQERHFFEDKLLFDESIGKPELLDESLFWTDELLTKFCKHLPPMLQRSNWKLIYSTAVHGTSINTLYRNSKKHAGPCVLCVLDEKGYVFGGFSSTHWQISQNYMGNGECFVFKLLPKFEVYEWTGENDFFMSGSPNALIMGGGEGRSAIWIHSYLRQGSSNATSTFGNPCMASSIDFGVQAIELWGIVDS